MRYYQTIKGKFWERLILSGGRCQLFIQHVTRPEIGRNLGEITRGEAAAWIKARRAAGRLCGPFSAAQE